MESGLIGEAGDSKLLISGEFTTFFKKRILLSSFFLGGVYLDYGFITVKQIKIITK